MKKDVSCNRIDALGDTGDSNSIDLFLPRNNAVDRCAGQIPCREPLFCDACTFDTTYGSKSGSRGGKKGGNSELHLVVIGLE